MRRTFWMEYVAELDPSRTGTATASVWGSVPKMSWASELSARNMPSVTITTFSGLLADLDRPDQHPLDDRPAHERR